MSASTVAPVESYLQTSECGIVAAAALLAFDYCLTFGQEVEWLVGSKWTAARVHFTSSRYLPFLAVAMAIPTSRVRPPSDASYCGALGMATNIVYYLCIVLAEAMLIVRTYAFWKRDRKILVGICTFGAVCMVVAIVASETIDTTPTGSVYKALDCLGIEGTLATAIQYICLILYELGMLALNCVAFWKMKRQNPPTRLIATLYRDGVIYIGAIAVFSVINAIVTLAAPIQFSDILNSPQMVMHSILASRIFFNLRETTRREQRNTIPMSLTDFRATSQGSSGFSNSLGTSSSTSKTGPKASGTGRVVDPATSQDSSGSSSSVGITSKRNSKPIVIDRVIDISREDDPQG